MELSAQDRKLVELGKLLRKANYSFTTITPASHKRILRRDEELRARSTEETALRDFFGWNKFVSAKLLPKEILDLLETNDLIELDRGDAKSRVRFSTIDGLIFMHSSFPTTSENAVFFGPDSYRFLRFLKENVKSASTIVDVGAGSGVGGLCLAKHLASSTGAAPKVILADINDRALHFAIVNAHVNGFTDVEVIKSDILDGCSAGADVVIANPPFVIDERERKYRHGGGNYGAELSIKIVEHALRYLAKSGGQLAVYTGASVVKGDDQFLSGVKSLLSSREFSYSEIDPDIFGEMLTSEGYEDVERVAAVGLSVTLLARG